MEGPRNDHAWANAEPGELERKRSLLRRPHVAPLTDYAQRIRDARPDSWVADFDPTEAGINAPILILGEAPGPKSVRQRGGSGFISPDNADSSARNMWEALREAAIDRSTDVVTWNIVPWYLGTAAKIRPAGLQDLREARPYVEELIGLLPDLKVVVLLGKKPAEGWSTLGFRHLPALRAPHPSPQNLNTRPHYREQLLGSLREALRRAGRP